MQQKEFTPKYVPLVWALAIFYAAPWLFAVPNLFLGSGTADWKLFWLIAGTLWAAAGLAHMRSLLVKRITFSDFIVVEMALQRPNAQRADSPVRIAGGTVLFHARPVQTQYIANSHELFEVLTQGASAGELQVICESAMKGTAWVERRNLISLIVFSLYMIAAVAFDFRPLTLIGPVTDAMIVGLAVMFVALGIIGILRANKKRKSAEEPS